jgi:serine/threonine protein kinase
LIVKPLLLEPGQCVGPYQIVSFVAAGGMGEVYRGRDMKLKRDVALKVLPEEFARDPGRMARFQREAEVLASLNHPNIAHIYGVEERALVMELVEGESPKGPMPFEDAWKIASQIAEGLSYAHEKGIIHRDLKPANIKITPDGVVKLLDFGLAKAYSGRPDVVGVDPSDSPTMTLGATVPGVILGTAAYMSPEQARGKNVDRRADIWAFGVVLYELLTGKQLFRGQDLTEILASIIKENLDLQAVPQRVRKLLEACLEKDPRKRLQSIGDVHYLMETGPAVEARPLPRLMLVLTAVTAVLLVSVTTLSILHFREQPPERLVMRFQISAPEANNKISSPLALSPDGLHLALTAIGDDGRTSLWIRALDSLEMRLLSGTEGASQYAPPFWSPDSRFIGFFADGKLKKIDVSGGPAQTLCAVEGPAGGSWDRGGVIIFSRVRNGIWRVPETGGAPVQITPITPRAILPWFLPDGRHFLYSVSSATPENNVTFLQSLDGREKKPLLGGSYSNATAYAPPFARGEKGHLLFLRQETLMAQPFDELDLQLGGEALPVARPVTYFSVSTNGVLAYRAGKGIIPTETDQQLAWFDRAGKPLGLIGPPGAYNDLALSPDGERVALTRLDSGDIWTLDLARNVPARFTFGPALDFEPVWSPDSKLLAFASRRDHGLDQIYWKDSSGIGSEEAVWKSTTGGQRPKAWSPDGKFLLFMRADANGGVFNLWLLPADQGRPAGARQGAPYFTSPFNITQGQFSPGPANAPHWVAYTSNESGQVQIYVQSFPAGHGKFPISTNGGVQPRWRKDGKELFYLSLEQKLMSVAVKTAPTFEYGTPKELFQTNISGGGNLANIFRYDVAPDGHRFLMLDEVGGGGTGPSPITVVTNWTAGLKR